MVVYYFPPFGSVGWSIRAVKFVKYLPDMGWTPIVLTISDDDYLINRGSRLSADEIPPDTRVYRARAVEPRGATFGRLEDVSRGSPSHRTKRAIRGALHMLGSTVLIPDDKILWIPFALRTGRKLARTERPDVVFATCPPYSAGIAGYALSRWVGKPFVLDIRDDWLTPMHLAGKTKPIRALERRMEAVVVRGASAVVLVTQASRADFVARYPDQGSGKFHYIPNGCDLAEYDDLTRGTFRASMPLSDGHFTILHSGSLRGSRDPSAMLAALRILRVGKPSVAEKLRVVFQGDIWSDYRGLLDSPDLRPIVRVCEFAPRDEYLQTSLAAQVMLVIADRQAPTLIPGKIYESWALGKPVLLLAEQGAAADLVRQERLGVVAQPNSAEDIANAILSVIDSVESHGWSPPSRASLLQFDRRHLAAELGSVLDKVVGREATATGASC